MKRPSAITRMTTTVATYGAASLGRFTIRPNMKGVASGRMSISTTSTKLETADGFASVFAAFAAYHPPPLLPMSSIEVQEATGPR